jgi:hypothetical protein
MFDGDFDNAQFVARLAKLPLAEQPETLWDYGHSTDVLGRVIEIASGQSLFAFEKQHLLDPLGMTDTAFYVADAAKRPLLAESLPDDRFVSPVAGIHDPMLPRRWESGGAGMVGAIGDYARFAQMLLNGGTLDGRRYLKPETVAAMTSDHIGPETHIAHDYFYFPGAGSGFGLGFAVRTAQAAETPSPPGEYRWDGVAGTFFFIDPHDDMFVICMMQSPSQRGRIETAVRDLVYQGLTPSALDGDQRAEPEFVQPQPVFAKAIRNRSTHTYVIFATVVNVKTGETRTECMAANFLLGAIRGQYDLDSSVASQQKAIQIALQTSPRVFHFSKQAAIDNLPSLGDAPSAKRWRDNFQAKYQKACSLVKQGRSVFLADITGQIRVEP